MKSLLLILSLFVVTTALLAQPRFIEATTFDEATLPAYRLLIKENPEIVIEYWEDYWSDGYDIDLDREDRNRDRVIYTAKEATSIQISDKTFDVYTKITRQNENSAEIYLGLGFGYDVYASRDQYSQEFEAARMAISRFESHFYRSYYGERLAEMTEELNDVREDRQDMQDDIDKEEKRRNRWREKIAKYEEKIQESIEEQSELRNGLQEKAITISELERKVSAIEANLRPWQ